MDRAPTASALGQTVVMPQQRDVLCGLARAAVGQRFKGCSSCCQNALLLGAQALNVQLHRVTRFEIAWRFET